MSCPGERWWEAPLAWLGAGLAVALVVVVLGLVTAEVVDAARCE